MSLSLLTASTQEIRKWLFLLLIWIIKCNLF